MGLMSHANDPARRKQHIAELIDEERLAMRAYVREAKRCGTSPRLLALASAWRAAKRALQDAIDHDRNLNAVPDAPPTHCTVCATPFDPRRPLKVLSPAGRGVCPGCARKLPFVLVAMRDEARAAA